jgi:hypothetical protein
MAQLHARPSTCSGGAPSAVEKPQMLLKVTCLASRQPEPHVWTIHERSFFPFSRIGGGMKCTKIAASGGASASASGAAGIVGASSALTIAALASPSSSPSAESPPAGVEVPGWAAAAAAAAALAPPYSSQARTSSGIALASVSGPAFCFGV